MALAWLLSILAWSQAPIVPPKLATSLISFVLLLWEVVAAALRRGLGLSKAIYHSRVTSLLPQLGQQEAKE